ncbi:hypothetical protein SAMN04490357_7303 [Streptomyces misionensis]|uniref:Lipoprotein n=1 Tax=Streptomyces misionensis TaxID=67331 RepID=A0A1H5H0C2_9ACTN|nr:hypothetical protein SAMN04490357_7303 [Streptomyces misionensis]
MKRVLVSALAGAALASMAACTSPGVPPRTSSPTTSRAASPRATTAGREEVTAAARRHLLVQLPAKDHPGRAPMSTAAVDRGAALFVWETGDRRFCFGSAAATGGAVMTSCASSPGSTAYSSRPTVVPLVVTVITDQHEVLGADREAVVKVTCDGSPLALRRLAPVLDGRRLLYAFDVPARTGGRVTVTVRRGHTTATEHMKLLWAGHGDRPSCR